MTPARVLAYRVVVILSRKLEAVLITGRWARYLDYMDVNFSSCWGRWLLPAPPLEGTPFVDAHVGVLALGTFTR